MAETFSASGPPITLASVQQIREQRCAARLVCACNAKGRTKAQRRQDLRMLLDMLDLWPTADPTA